MFGILSVNIWYFASAAVNVGVEPDWAAADQSAYALSGLLFEAKSYVLFAFLFGYSFVLQDGPHFVRRMRRRMAALIVIGLVQAVLFWPGDILVLYGLLGFVLITMRDLTPRRALVRGVRLTVLAAGICLALGLADGMLGGSEDGTGNAADAVEQALSGYTGGVVDVLSSNLAAYPFVLLLVLLAQGLPAFGAMLAGLAAGRVGLFSDADAMAAVWRRLWPWAPILGAFGAVLNAAGRSLNAPGADLIIFGVTLITAPMLTATYVALLLGWLRSRPGSAILNAIAAIGRLALSNYLFQSVAMALIFTGYGLALMDDLSAAQTWLAIIGIYLLQAVASVLWVRRHRYGPAEWLLRRWTLGEARPRSTV